MLNPQSLALSRSLSSQHVLSVVTPSTVAAPDAPRLHRFTPSSAGGTRPCAACRAPLGVRATRRCVCGIAVHKRCAAAPDLPPCPAARPELADLPPPAGPAVPPVSPSDLSSSSSSSPRLKTVGRDPVVVRPRLWMSSGCAVGLVRAVVRPSAVLEVPAPPGASGEGETMSVPASLVPVLTDAANRATSAVLAPRLWSSQPVVPYRVFADAPPVASFLLDAPPAMRDAEVVDGDNVFLPLPVRLVALTCPAAVSRSPYVSIQAMGGGVALGGPVGSVCPQQAPNSAQFAWCNEWLSLPDVAHLHAAAVLLFSIVSGDEGSGARVVLAHVHVPLCDALGAVRVGRLVLPLWPDAGSHVNLDTGTPPPKQDAGTLEVWIGPLDCPAPIVYRSARLAELLEARFVPLEFEEAGQAFTADVAAPTITRSMHMGGRRGGAVAAGPETAPIMPLEILTPADRALVWETRDASDPRSVVRALLAADHAVPLQRAQVADFCAAVTAAGTRLPRYMAIHLLSHAQPSALVRYFAMRNVLAWRHELAYVALAILGILCFPATDLDPASICLLRTLLSSRRSTEVRAFVWALRALADQPLAHGPRMRSYLHALLGALPAELRTELTSDGEFVAVINALAKDPGRRERTLADLVAAPEYARLRDGGRVVGLPGDVRVRQLNVARSRVLSSHAAPLMLRFDLADGGEKTFIWKAGDDLGADQLVLTMGTAMNDVWKTRGLPAFVVAYQVSPTGHLVGAIEMVPGCTSLGAIQGNWAGAFKPSAITEWLRSRGPGQADWQAVRSRFAASLAGACVFEWVLGLGDRHCDNLLMQQDGTIFHIDFGCCFGRDYGLAQDSPFSITTQMMDVLGGVGSPGFTEFEALLVAAFIAVREHRSFFTGLVMAALGARLPHVQRVSDARVVHDAFMPSLVAPEAENVFRELVARALASKRQQLNDSLHTFYMDHFYQAPPSSK